MIYDVFYHDSSKKRSATVVVHIAADNACEAGNRFWDYLMRNITVIEIKPATVDPVIGGDEV